MANNISVRNAKDEYDAFVAAHRDPSISYGTGSGWGFPTSSFSPSRTGCSFGANQIISRTTIDSSIVCKDPVGIINSLFDTVLGYIPDKVKPTYGRLILAFKKIGQLKMNRLKNDGKFQTLCSQIAEISTQLTNTSLATTEKRALEARKKELQAEFSEHVKNTMKEILIHIPACQYERDFVEFVFAATELALNNSGMASASSSAPVASGSGSGSGRNNRRNTRRQKNRRSTRRKNLNTRRH